jgi:hypothetical protein
MRQHQQLTRSHLSPLVSLLHCKHQYNVEHHRTNLQLLLHSHRTATLPPQVHSHRVRLGQWQVCLRLVTSRRHQANLPLLRRNTHPHQFSRCHLRQLHCRQGVRLKAHPALVLLQVDLQADRRGQTRDLALLSHKALRQPRPSIVSFYPYRT